MKLMIGVTLIALGVVPASASIPLDVFNYTGTCTDCTFSNGQLELFAPYTLGAAITSSNFVNFTYTSNLLNFSINQDDPGFSVSGSLPSVLPSPADLVIEDDLWEFSTSSSGSWFVEDLSIPRDFGPNNIWAGAASSAPEPGTIAMLGLGLAAAGIRARYRRARDC
jgi:PEP-CTERM motif